MSNNTLLILVIAEILIIIFASFRAKRKFTSISTLNDANSYDGGAASFNFWFFFLNLILLAVILENYILGLLALALYLIRIKLKKIK
jgi:hypothetical protein